jgi:hypothetical protein
MTRCIRLICAAFLCAAAGLSCAAHRSPQPPLTAADGGPTLCQRYGKEASPRAKRSRFGFFTSRFWRDYELNLRIEIDRFGARPGYSLWYMGMDRPFPAKIARINKKHRINLVISHDIRHRSLDLAHNQRLLAEIADGLWDEYFRQFARDARKFRRTVYYRFGYEMNGGWFPWGRKPDDFRAAWRRVHKLFADERAENVKWVFSPNVLWGDHQFDEHILAYYPGYEYVDIVGLDGYNFGDNFDDWHQWRSFDDLFGESLEGAAMFGKPIWIAEIGCAAGEGRIEWVYDMLDYLDRNPCIEAFFWFDDHKRGEPDFSIASDQEVLPVVRDWLGADSPDAQGGGPLAALRNLLTFF